MKDKKLIKIIVATFGILLLFFGVYSVERLYKKIQTIQNRIVILEDRKLKDEATINNLGVHEMYFLGRLCRLEKNFKNCRFSY